MRALLQTAALVAAVVVSACGDDSPANGDANPGSDADIGDALISPAQCSIPQPWSAVKQPARTITVSSSTQPGMYVTIEAAAAAATPGTRILLLAGTHTPDQFVADLRGTEDAPIWISGSIQPQQVFPVISGGAQALQLERPAYVVIEGIEVQNATSNGINIDDGGDFDDVAAANHVVVDNVKIHDIGTASGNNDCLKVSGINDLFVQASTFRNCGGGGSGIDHVGVHHSVVYASSFDARMENAVQSKGGSTDHDIRGNNVRITGPRAFNLGGSTDLDLFRPSLSMTAPNAEARRIRAFDNTIWNLGPQATPFAFVGCVDCVAAHNAARDHQRWHLRILQETATSSPPYTFEPAKNGLVANNIFEFTAADLATAVNVGTDTDAASFVFRNNVWFASDNPTQSAPTLPSTETGGIVGEDPNVPWQDSLDLSSFVCVPPPPLYRRGYEIPIGFHDSACDTLVGISIGPFPPCVPD
jgi:hypothetical protein